MALDVGTRLGPYEVVASIGAGGMGEVYKARDTRLDRTVAIKVLPPSLAGDAEGRARFEREAKTIAGLNHPHICSLHDVGDHNGSPFLVMEHLAGETLASRLQNGPLPVEQALTVATEIADALSAAHRAGVVHRDLKPGNVMLTKAGVKLLDFGLAKLAGSPALGATSLVTAERITEKGLVLGTVPYMAPEQLEGKEADSRADIFAFGTTLYEMLTGRNPFEGSSHASVIAAIVDRDLPPVSSLAPLSPPLLDHVVMTCLAKDPDKRWQCMADVLIELRLTAAAPRDNLRTLHRRRPLVGIGWGTVTFLLAVGGLLAGAFIVRSRTPQPVKFTFDVPVPPSVRNLQFAVSPTSDHFVMPATSLNGREMLWLQSLEDKTGEEIPGTDDAGLPFWSPDGRSIGFFTSDKLKSVDLKGGPPRTLCDAPGNTSGGTWSREGIVVFGSEDRLFRVPAGGGDRVPVTELDPSRQEIAHRQPFFLPDGRHFLYVAISKKPANSAIFVGSLDSKERTFLAPAQAKAEFAAPDRLLLVRDRTLFAYRFDPARRQLKDKGSPVGSIGSYPPNSAAPFSVSANGTLVLRYRNDDEGANRVQGRLDWFDRSGREIATAGAGMENARIAPGGKLLAVVERQGDTAADVWVVDLERGGIGSRLTFDPAADELPLWSPDGRSVVFRSNRGGVFDLYRKAVGGGIGSERPLLKTNHNKAPVDWSADGRFILYQDIDPETGPDLWLLPMTGDHPGTPQPLLRSKFSEIGGRLSPAGPYVAYVSDESGRMEVYVQQYPNAGNRLKISANGGRTPRWRDDGKELFFLAGTTGGPFRPGVMAVDLKVSPDGSLSAGVPHKLFDVPDFAFTDRGAWDIGPGDQRFLFHVLRPTIPLTVIANWAAGTMPRPES